MKFIGLALKSTRNPVNIGCDKQYAEVKKKEKKVPAIIKTRIYNIKIKVKNGSLSAPPPLPTLSRTN